MTFATAMSRTGARLAKNGGSRIVDSEPTVIHAATFGVKADGVHDDAAALNQATAFAYTLYSTGFGAPTVEMPAGTLLVGSSITVRDGVVLRGAGGATQAGIQSGTIVQWNGDGGTIFKVWGREQCLENFSIIVTPGKTADRAFDVTQYVGGNACTAVTMRRIFVRGTSRITYGAVFGDTSSGLGSYPYNCDYMTLDHVYFYDCITAGLYCPNDTGQCKHYRLDSCVFYGSPYGILATRIGVKCISTGFGYHETAAVYIAAASDSHEFIGSDVESCARFYETPGPSGAGQNLTITGGRYDASTGLHADGRYIKIGNPGATTITGTLFAGASGTNWHIYFDTSRQSKVITTGCNFPNQAGGYTSLLQGNYSDWSRVGCTWTDGSSQSLPIPDMSSGTCLAVTTTNNTQTTGTTYRVDGVSSTQVFRATISAHEVATGDCAVYCVLATVKVASDGTVTLKDQDVISEFEDQAAWAGVVDVNTPLLRCRVTGENAKTIAWNTQLESVQSSKTA